MILLVRVFVFVVVAIAPCVVDIAVAVDFFMLHLERGGRWMMIAKLIMFIDSILENHDDLEKDDDAAKVEDIVLEKDEMKNTTPTFLN